MEPRFVLEQSDDLFPSKSVFQKFYFGKRPLSRRAWLAGFLSIWLKKFIIPTGDVVVVGAILPSVRLAHGVRVALLPTIIANIQSGLRQVAAAFLESPTKTLRVKLVYTYLVAWYVLHCPTLMNPIMLYGVL